MVPLLAAIAGDRGGGGCTRWRIGRGAVPGCHCWAAIAGCHCWAAIAGDRGGVGVHVGGLDVVPLLAATAGCHSLPAIAGCHCWAAIAGV